MMMKPMVIVVMAFILFTSVAIAQNPATAYYPRFDYGKLNTYADSSMLVMPDSTFSRSAKKIIWGSVNEFWNPPLFKLATLTRPLPIEFEMRVTTAGDTLVVTDRREPSTNIVFVAGTNNLVGGATISSIAQRNGIFLIGTASGVVVYNWYKNVAYRYTTIGVLEYTGTDDYTNRNSGSGWVLMNSNPAIISNTVNDEKIIDDPLGSVDDVGCPNPIISVATSSGNSLSSPGITAFYDGVNLQNIGKVLLSPTGDILHKMTIALDYVDWYRYVQSISADNWGSGGTVGRWNMQGQGGGQMLPGGTGQTINDINALWGASVAQQGNPVWLIGASNGLVISHVAGGTVAYDPKTATSLTFFVDATRNSPSWSGASGTTPPDSLGWSFESLADSNNIWTKKLTRTGTGAGVTIVNGVIGKADSLDGTENGVLRHWADPSLKHGTSAYSVFCWIKPTAITGATQVIWEMESGLNGHFTGMWINPTTGTIEVDRYGSGGNSIGLVGPAFAVGNWYHTVFAYDGTNARLYLNGELVAGPTSATGSANADSLQIGAGMNTPAQLTQYFKGLIDEFNIVPRALTQNEVRKLYTRGLHGLVSTIDSHDALDTTYVAGVSVDLVSNRWFATWGSGNGLRDSVTIWTADGIPWRRYGSPGGNIQTVVIRSTPGTDSLSVCIGTTTKTKWIQVDPKISDLASNYRPTYPDHEGWARHVSTPGDSGTTIEGGVTITSADSAGTFHYSSATNGNLRVGGNAEFRGTIRWGASSAVAADIAEMFATAASNFRVIIKSISSDVKEIFLPPFARISTITVMDNDSTRTYPIELHRGLATQQARLILRQTVAREGRTGNIVSDVVYAKGVEVGDILSYRLDSTTVCADPVISVRSDTVSLFYEIPKDTPFSILPPSLLLKFTGTQIQAGDVVQMGPAKTMRLSLAVGKKAWVVSTSPSTVMNADLEGVAVVMIGTAPASVSSDSGAVGAGDRLTAGVGGVLIRAKAVDEVAAYAQEAVATGVKKISVLVSP